MKNVVPSGNPYAGNPHARFEEEEVTSTNPKRGSLRYTAVGWLGKSLAAFLCIASVHPLFGAWYDSPVVKAQVDIGYAGNYAYYMNLSEDGCYLMVNTQSGNDSFPVQLYATADLNGTVGAASGLALGEAFGRDLFGTGGNGWKGGAISAKLGVMIPGSGAPASGSAVYTALEVPATRWTKNVSAFAVSGLGATSIDGMDFNPSGTKLYCNNKDPQNKILAYPVTDGHTFGTPAEFTVAAATRIRNLSVYSIGGKELVYFGEGNVGSGAKAVYVLDPATGLATALVTDATRFASNIMNVKVSNADSAKPILYVQTESSGLFVYELAADGKSVLSATPVAEFTAAQVAAFCGSPVTCSVASFEVSPDGRFAYFVGLTTTGFASPALTVVAADATAGATVIDTKTLDGTETFAVTANTVVKELTVTADSTVEIADGVTLTVGILAGAGVLTKSGAGEFVLEKGSASGSVKVVQGGLSVSGTGAPVALPPVASAAILHLDASDEKSLVLAGTSWAVGQPQVAEWHDVRGAGYPYGQKLSGFNGAQLPYLTTDLFAGKPVMDFSTTEQWSGPAMGFSSSLSVGDVFLVAEESTKTMPFLTDATTSTHGSWQKNQWADSKLINGLTICDGVALTYAERTPAGMHVIRYRPTAAVPATGLAHMANTYGGVRIAEMIVFGSQLADADAASVSDYLARKWQVAAKLGKLTVAAGARASVGGGVGLQVGTLASQSVLEAIAGAEPAELATAKIHLDASKTATFTYPGDVKGSYKRINKWVDVRGASYPYAMRTGALTMPYVNTDALAGGVEILDFDVAGWGTATLSFSESISVAEAFIVVKDPDNGQSIINDTAGNGKWQHNEWASGNLTGGLVEVDGEATTYAAAYPAGLHVFHIKPKAALPVASMVRRDTWYGGMQIGEMVLFTSAVSADAATRINNYLKAKWTQTAVWGPAREFGASVDVGSASVLSVDSFAENVNVAKAGAGSLLVSKGSPSASVAVEGGTLEFASAGSEIAAPTVVASASLHLDASDSDSLVLADTSWSGGQPQVAEWHDVRGTGYPYGQKLSGFNGAQLPYLTTDLFAGKPVMDFSTTEQWSGPTMGFSSSLSVGDVFLVAEESTKTMPFLTDATTSSQGSWQKNQWADANLTKGLTTCDGVALTYAERTPAGMHVIRYRPTAAVSATGLAHMANTYGGVRIAEMIVFSSALSDANAIAVADYLRRKWQRADVGTLSFGKGAEVAVGENLLVKVATVKEPTNGKVTLGENAMLVLPAGVTPGEIVSAGGTVDSDLALNDDFILEVPDLAKPLKVNGTLTLPALGTIRIGEKISFSGQKATYTLVNADSISVDGTPDWTVVADPAKYGYEASVQGDQLLLDVTKPGVTILIR